VFEGPEIEEGWKRTVSKWPSATVVPIPAEEFVISFLSVVAAAYAARFFKSFFVSYLALWD